MKRRGGFAVLLIIGLFFPALAAFAQTPPSNPEFEVATVKPSAPLDFAKLREAVQAGRMPRFGAHVDGAQAVYTYMTLKDLIANAYDLKAYQITGPGWLGSERFDIDAKMPDGASKDDAPKMLQALLAERFKLAAHRETQEHSVLALLVAKDGPKLKEAPAPTEAVDENAPAKPGEMKIDGPNGPLRISRNSDGSTTVNMGAKGTITQRMDMQSQIMNLESSSVTMSGFADMLTSLLQMGGGGGRQVVDMTGLKGNYQVAVDISLADAIAAARAQGMVPLGAQSSGGAAAASPAAAASDPAGGGSTVFASVKKLGLKLEPRKAQVEQLVIDHVEKTPTEN